MRLRLSILAWLVLSAVAAHAAITGVISGTVMDPTGAIVPGVTVTAQNQDTGVKQTAVTDGKGFYTFPVLDVGNYSVTAAQTGFNTFTEKNVHIDANSSVRVDISLKVGSTTESVEVTSNAVQVETQNTQVGEVIESAKMTAVPLNGRAYTDLLALQPGVSPYAAASESASEGGKTVSGGLNAGNMSINGGREASNGYMVNGADVNDGVENGTAIIPNLDSISEFRIITSNFDAEYGNFSGGQVNVVTKNGTNQFHGSAFEFFRNTALNAANWYAVPRNTRGPYNQNIYGGTFGGPIKRDKIFFFADYQGTNQSIGQTTTFQTLTTQNLSGNLSDAATGYNGATQPYFTGSVNGAGWASVLSGRLGYTVANNEPYYVAGCTSTSQCVFPGAVIPQSAWDPVSKNLVKYIHPANTTQGGLPYYSVNTAATTLKDNKEAMRVDVNTRLGVVFGYYFLDNYTQVNPYGGGSNGNFPSQNAGRSQLVNLGLTTTFKNNAVNTLRVSYMRSVWHADQPAYQTPGPTLASLGFDAPWSKTGSGISPIAPALEGVPQMSLSEGGGFGTPGAIDGHWDNTYQFLDNFMKVVGTHTFQWGGSFHYDEIDERNYDGPNGVFSFNDGGNDVGGETGMGFADFLLGADSASFTQSDIQVLDNRGYYLGTFAEDSWRARSNLTLNYGLRYEITTPWWDTTNKVETIVPGLQSKVFPGAPVGWVFPGDPGVPKTLAPIKYDKFAPRVGFDYAPTSTTSVRGGAGVFYTSFQEESGYEEAGDAPFGNYYSVSNGVILHSPYTDRATNTALGSPFPVVWPPKNVSISNPDTTYDWASAGIISTSWAVRTTNTVPYVVTYFLGTQHEFGRNSVLTLNYVGNQGRHLANAEEANPGNPALCLSLDDPSEVQGSVTCGPGQESRVYTRTNGQVVQGTRPTLGIAFGSNPYSETTATSNYNSLQTNFRHSSKYWDILVGYTWGKSMDTASGLTEGVNPYSPKSQYAISKYNVAHYLVASYNLHLPFADWTSNRAVKAIVGGWGISGISKFASGLPVTLTDAEDYSLIGSKGVSSNGVDVPYIKNGNLFAGGANGDRNPRNGNAYFNTSLFTKESKQCSNPINCYGLYGNSKRRFFSGPGLDVTDLAVLRDFHIHERNVFEARFEAFNFLNHAQFGLPSGNANSGAFGKITTSSNERVLQAAIKYHF